MAHYTSAYGSCDNASFFFHDSASAQAASQALLDQVLINQAPYAFDDQPVAVLGCSGISTFSPCELFTPYERNAPGTGFFQFWAAHNCSSFVGCGSDFIIFRAGNSLLATTTPATGPAGRYGAWLRCRHRRCLSRHRWR